MQRLTVLYDERCAVCRRAKGWLASQPCLVEVELLAAGSPDAQARYRGLPWLGHELVAIDDEGNGWVGPAAFLTCLWATARYRPWSYRLSGRLLAPLAERFFLLVSRHRMRWSEWLGPEDADCSWCDQVSLRRGPP